MSKVWRYHLAPTMEGQSPVPEPGESFYASPEMEPGAEVIGVGFTTGGVTVYALVEGTGVTEPRTFYVAANDAELPPDVGAVNFRGTAKVLGGPTAHVFDVAQVPAEA
jgi:hypothetical protein